MIPVTGCEELTMKLTEADVKTDTTLKAGCKGFKMPGCKQDTPAGLMQQSMPNALAVL